MTHIGGGSQDTHCPGYINPDDTAANPSPHLSDFAEISWTLNDHDGFKAFLNDTLGVDLDTLVPGGSWVVSRNGAIFNFNRHSTFSLSSQRTHAAPALVVTVAAAQVVILVLSPMSQHRIPQPRILPPMRPLLRGRTSQRLTVTRPTSGPVL
jgi:hypothetical protein